MEKRRVYQVAKEKKLSSDALISILMSMGHEVKSHMSVVTEEMMGSITRKIEEEKRPPSRTYSGRRSRSSPRKGRRSEPQERPRPRKRSRIPVAPGQRDLRECGPTCPWAAAARAPCLLLCQPETMPTGGASGVAVGRMAPLLPPRKVSRRGSPTPRAHRPPSRPQMRVAALAAVVEEADDDRRMHGVSRTMCAKP